MHGVFQALQGDARCNDTPKRQRRGTLFSGTVYINNYEFVCIDQLTESKYMVYINNPSGHDNEQWVFGYYKTFARALNKATAIVGKREYPKPVETW